MCVYLPSVSVLILWQVADINAAGVRFWAVGSDLAPDVVQLLPQE